MSVQSFEPVIGCGDLHGARCWNVRGQTGSPTHLSLAVLPWTRNSLSWVVVLLVSVVAEGPFKSFIADRVLQACFPESVASGVAIWTWRQQVLLAFRLNFVYEELFCIFSARAKTVLLGCPVYLIIEGFNGVVSAWA